MTSQIRFARIERFFDHQKKATLNGHNFAKNQYFLMRFFLFGSYKGGLSISQIKMGG